MPCSQPIQQKLLSTNKCTIITLNLGQYLGDGPARAKGLHFQAKRKSLRQGLKERRQIFKIQGAKFKLLQLYLGTIWSHFQKHIDDLRTKALLKATGSWTLEKALPS